ncbi:MAG: DNA/RNA non-specific endonuclease [Bavariicoccus seileri]|uniref:DNA/RNA non-specific endonuclease n=1 Tax=Bavariicoccus seileri TaxID=549685 RepID=UPI003F98B163
MKHMKKKQLVILSLLSFFLIGGCSSISDEALSDQETAQSSVGHNLTSSSVNSKDLDGDSQDDTEESTIVEDSKNDSQDDAQEESQDTSKVSNEANKTLFEGYRQLTVDGGDLSGHRQANVVVDIGYGDREYWAFTNEYGQLVRVVADQITLQDDYTEPVLPSGRYYPDEAHVPGVERDDLDQGHIIADSLGGVSNAYNITPQDSTLNRHGDQAYMEKVIRDAGGASNFEAIITYPDTTTQIPSHYKYTYTVMGNVVVDEFDNVNPDEVNAQLNESEKSSSDATNGNGSSETAPASDDQDVSKVDTNGNGQVTIKEAKAAGFQMPITRDHWLYQYMRDNDNDGMVGE